MVAQTAKHGKPLITIMLLLTFLLGLIVLHAPPALALVSGLDEKQGSGRKALSSELLRRTPLTNKSAFKQRLRQVSSEVCKSNKSCVKNINKEQTRRGGSCSVKGNATACDKLSDARIIGTQKGLGTKGRTGGKVIAKTATKAGLATATIGSILLDGNDQKHDPDYVDGDRAYLIVVQGKSRKTNQTKPLKGVKVNLKVHAVHGEKNGCKNNGTGHEGIFSPELSAKTSDTGAVDFQQCSHQQITIKLEDIPKGYKKVWNQPSGRAVIIVSPLDDPNRHEDKGIITITLEELEPKKSKQSSCTAEASRVLSKEKNLSGSHGGSGGNSVTYRGNSRAVVIHDIMASTSALDFKEGTTKECQEQISRSRTYVVRAYTTTYPKEKGDNPKKILQSFPAELKFSGPGSCKTPNPHQSGSDGYVTFKGCSRNQIDLEIDAPASHPVVHKYSSKGGNVRVSGRATKTGGVVTIYVYFENELQPYSNAQKAKFAAAANRYWNSIPRNVGPMHISQAVCKPSDVTYGYEPKSYFGSKPWALASAGQGQARFRPCRISWNKTAERIRDNSNMTYACITFVHEYGHLLGYEHSTNPKYMMYAFPNWRDPTLLRATGC